MTTPTSSSPDRDGTSVWRRFRRAHLFDYNPAATRGWLAIVAAGGLALAWALIDLAALRWDHLWLVLSGVGLVLLASWFPVKLPRSSLSYNAADIFTFTLLVSSGVGAAVLAVAAEGALAAQRSSKRLSSHAGTPAAAAMAMLCTGSAYTALLAGLQALGLGEAVAILVALCAVMVLHVPLVLLPLSWLMAVKRGERLDVPNLFRAYGWMGAVYLFAAFVAGLAHLNTRQFGVGVLAVGAVVCLGIVALLRATLAWQEREHHAQETRIAEAEREAQINQQRFSAAFNFAAVGMAIVGPQGQVMQVNQALCRLLGRPERALLGHRLADHLHPSDLDAFLRHTDEVLQSTRQAFSMELRGLSAQGADIWLAVHGSHFDDPGKAGTCLIYQLHDISQRRDAESRLQHIAFHDALTDLANRHGFERRLANSVERSRLSPAQRFAVMFLDLDRFKVVNDSLGHVAGNEVLREVGRRLQTSLRPGDLVARLGGDEFALLLEDLASADDGLRLAQRLLHTLSQPVTVQGTEIVPAASIGITFSDMGYRTVDEVLRDADIAMYEAKAAGRGRVALFDSSMHERRADRLALEADLRRAIGLGQLSLVYQPLYHLDPQRPYGFEALARWVHPERGVVSPAVFITLAEETGQIEALTDWVINEAVQQMAQWQHEQPQMAQLGMHVNISGRDLARPDLVDSVQEMLQCHGVAPQLLTLEITETTLMSRLDVALHALGRLKLLGVRLSIDDFGTGYSSLAYLSTLPIDSLKIDRSFVMHMHTQPQNIEIVRAVSNLGVSLGKQVIAEGIETPAQLEALKRIGVHIGQGYLLSRPLRGEQVVQLMSGHRQSHH